MITFGELRKKSVAWQTEISTVEKIYARDWLVKSVFDNLALRATIALSGASALASAYFSDYPRVEDIDFLLHNSSAEGELEREMENIVKEAARVSGLTFRVQTFQPTQTRIEFTGPLGRRSAAQPLIVARFVSTMPRAEPSRCALVHPFTDTCAAEVRAVSLNELAAEHIVRYARAPRARDVYDLWFIVTHDAELDRETTRTLAQTLAQEKKVVLRTELEGKYAPLLERAWDNALKNIPAHPPFQRAREEIETRLQEIIV